MAELSNDDLSNEVERLRNSLTSIEPLVECRSKKFPDERFSFMACEEALTALVEGNYGVGCVLVSKDGDVVERAHNQVFHPYFRSDGHAEMILMNSFEERYQHVRDMSDYILHCSLEPCPMCVGRLINARVATVKYVALDDGGGMMTRIDKLPRNFRNLSMAQTFVQSTVSPTLQHFAAELFSTNLALMRSRLVSRLPMG